MTRNGAVPSWSSFFFPWLSLLFFAMIPPHQEARSSVTLDLSPSFFEAMVSESKLNETQDTRIPGCIECGLYRCPENVSKCLLGFVSDPCGCCKTGVCARLEGESCWNSSIQELPPKSRQNGLCAQNYFCQLRSDLEEEDEAEAICTCMEQTLACGSDEITYETPCALHEKAMRLGKPLSLRHLGPCQVPPQIVYFTERVCTNYGHRVLLMCESKGFPVPDIYWKLDSIEGKKFIIFPGEEDGFFVQNDQNSTTLTTTSWLQVPRLTREFVGTYRCIANNSLGEAAVLSFVSSV